ncbi:MAG: hypothetical protein U0414_04025 [Polyangiaceae bacterium]
MSAREVAHAMPVMQSAHPTLRPLPAPRLAAIRRLAERCGVGDGALRTALSRACASGSLAVSEGRYRLGPQSIEQADAARALLQRAPGYVLGVVLEGERADLPRLHELFERLGFRALQRSLWIGARTRHDRLSEGLRRAGLAHSAVVFHADEVDAGARARLARLWGLRERASELRRFHHRLVSHIAAPGLGSAEAAWRCVEAAPIWYRVAVHDEPPFPLDLCGADYPLDALNADFRSHLALREADLVALWRAEETAP